MERAVDAALFGDVLEDFSWPTKPGGPGRAHLSALPGWEGARGTWRLPPKVQASRISEFQ